MSYQPIHKRINISDPTNPFHIIMINPANQNAAVYWQERVSLSTQGAVSEWSHHENIYRGSVFVSIPTVASMRWQLLLYMQQLCEFCCALVANINRYVGSIENMIWFIYVIYV